MKLSTAYGLVKSVASPSDAEGLKKERAILLLWYLRNVMGIDDLDAYEYVCDGDRDQGVDGLYLEQGSEEGEKDVLYIFQSRYPTKPKRVGVADVRTLLGAATYFETVGALDKLLLEDLEPELRALLQRFELRERLVGDAIETKLVLVTAGSLTAQARAFEGAANEGKGRPYVKCVDAFDLAPLIQAFRSPSMVKTTITVSCPADMRFVSSFGDCRVAVCSVAAEDIVRWPGIADRALFDLNVRRELRMNKVRKAIDRAIRRTADHANFVAFHNGLTVVCREFDDSDPASLTVTDLSVVNGTQSSIAFYENASFITDTLRVIVKFVEAPPDRQLAREVAVRSNTQNPVNARNLRARDGIQLRLVAEFGRDYPRITYEIRPDASIRSAHHVIQNDDAAQLLCAVYRQQPWIAIRRLSLFDAERYPTIFRAETTASHVVLVDRIAMRVQNAKQKFPAEYLRSWRLTKLVGVYLVGQLLRTKPELEAIVNDPKAAIDEGDLNDRLDLLVKFAAAAMQTRRDRLVRDGELDDFKVEFKREKALRGLAAAARDHYLTYRTVED